jgi:hypothetical protein
MFDVCSVLSPSYPRYNIPHLQNVLHYNPHSFVDIKMDVFVYARCIPDDGSGEIVVI